MALHAAASFEAADEIYPETKVPRSRRGLSPLADPLAAALFLHHRERAAPSLIRRLLPAPIYPGPLEHYVAPPQVVVRACAFPSRRRSDVSERPAYRDVNLYSFGELGQFTDVPSAARVLKVAPSTIIKWCRDRRGFGIQPRGPQTPWYIPLHALGKDFALALGPLPSKVVHRFTQHNRVALIKAALCSRYYITHHDLISDRRCATLLRPRHLAIYLASKFSAQSLPQLGRQFGHRDHTSILHAKRKIERLRSEDPSVATELEVLEQYFTEKFAEIDRAASAGAAA